MDKNIQVAGAGFAELPVPAGLRLARALLAFGLFLGILTAAFALSGWSWVTAADTDGLGVAFAVWCATVMTAAVGAPLAVVRLNVLNRIVNIRVVAGRTVFGGFRSAWRPLGIVGLIAALFGLAAFCVYESARTRPIPDLLTKLRLEIKPPQPEEKLVPIYFWDYATFINPAWLDRVNIVLPYEKGPPQKLIPKIFFEDATTHAIVLQLHGRRPRQYSQSDVYALFELGIAQPADWPLAWRLEREAGLTAEGLNVPVLYLMRLNQGISSQVTHAIGVPWAVGGGDNPDGTAPSGSGTGRFFFWGPDGSVFQVKCPSPCAMSRMLELVQFPADPRGSRAERLEWTKKTLRSLLAANTRQDGLLSLYLVSMLTQDPRDPEAYFHLGKLARNLTTLRSAISFGRDVGLEPEKIIELQAEADRLSE